MTKSRWANWSRGTEDKVGFGSFMKEAIDSGNPSGTGTVSPAERASQLGLQSDGSGGYTDESGNVVARTVNNELVFYDQRGATGGVVSDGEGGQQLATAQPSWSDPKTGMLTTPPAQPESPEEMSAVPDATPSVAPSGYSEFMKKKKQLAYAEPEEQEQPAEMGGGAPPMDGMMGGMMGDGDMGLGDAGGMMGEDYEPENLQKRVTPEVKKPISAMQALINKRPEPQTLASQLAKPEVQQTQPEPEVQKPQVQQQEPEEESFDSLFANYGNTLNETIGNLEKDQTKAERQRKSYAKQLQMVMDNPNIDEKQKRMILNSGSRLMKEYKPVRKDVAMNELSDKEIDGLLNNEEALKEAYAIDPETGFPTPDKIRQYKQNKKVHDFDDDVLSPLFKSLPRNITGQFGGQGVNPYDSFKDWFNADGNDIFTDQYLNPAFINMDHSIPGSTVKKNASPEMKEFVGSSDNLIALSKAINQTMLSKEKGQFIDDIKSQYGNPENRVEGLQDFISELNNPRFELRGNMGNIIRDLLMEGGDDGHYTIRDDVDYDAVGNATKTFGDFASNMVSPFEERLKSLDPDGLMGTSRSGLKDLDEGQRSKRDQLRKASKIIEDLKTGRIATKDIFSLLGGGKFEDASGKGNLTRTFNPTTERGAGLGGGGDAVFSHAMDKMLERLTGEDRETQIGSMNDWVRTLADSNKVTKKRWEDSHADDGGKRLVGSQDMDNNQILEQEGLIKKDAARHFLQSLSDNGFLSEDGMDDKMKETLKGILGQQAPDVLKPFMEGLMDKMNPGRLDDVDESTDDTPSGLMRLIQIFSELDGEEEV